jgi:hypothetical protein
LWKATPYFTYVASVLSTSDSDSFTIVNIYIYIYPTQPLRVPLISEVGVRFGVSQDGTTGLLSPLLSLAEDQGLLSL